MGSPSAIHRPSVILLLGGLSTISPLAIDMYLPAFAPMAADLHSIPAEISLSLSSYFVGLSCGQLFYGPLLDRFGRKRPLGIGLTIFLLATLGCLRASSAPELIALRFVQALGGCAASVASVAMVNDFFPERERSKIFSLLMLILGVSPLLAPTIGSVIVGSFGWRGIFVALAGVVAAILASTLAFLPEGHVPDPTVTLRPRPILAEYLAILKVPKFHTYALSGACSFSGLFVYLAGSPIIFMDVHQVSARAYGMIFAGLAAGFIGGSQLNLFLLRKFSSETIFRRAQQGQLLAGAAFLVAASIGELSLPATIAFLFVCLSCTGLVYPNAAATALQPFTRNAGSASALLGFLQMGIGAVASAGVGLLGSRSLLPIVGVLFGSALSGTAILRLGQYRTSDLA